MPGLMLEQDRKSQTPITVKLIVMGRGITNYVADPSLTLGQLLEQCNVSDQMDVRVNGATVEKSYRLGSADQVLVVPKIHGGRR